FHAFPADNSSSTLTRVRSSGFILKRSAISRNLARSLSDSVIVSVFIQLPLDFEIIIRRTKDKKKRGNADPAKPRPALPELPRLTGRPRAGPSPNCGASPLPNSPDFKTHNTTDVRSKRSLSNHWFEILSLFRSSNSRL